MRNPLLSGYPWRTASILLTGLAASTCLAGDFQTFADALRDRGWHVTQDANANLFLHPRSTRSAPQASAHGGSDALAARLAAAGWDVRRGADGSILFSAASHESTAVRGHKVAQRAVADHAHLGDRLAAAGWNVEHAVDGSLLFRAKGNAPQQAVAKTAARPTRGLETFGDRLAATGWNVEHAADGSLLFRSRNGAPAQAAVAAAPRPDTGLGGLDSQLASTRWQVARGQDGSLRIWAAAQSG
jgi:hypothetical protein